MTKSLLKLFVAVTGFLMGFSVPVVAQYGAPSDVYKRIKDYEDKRFVTNVDTQSCKGSYIEIEATEHLVFFEEKIVEEQDELSGLDPPLTSDEAEITVYPNPCSEKATIKITDPLQRDAVVRIYDMNGQLLEERNCELSGNTATAEIIMQGYTKGNYLVTVALNEELYLTKKIVKY